MMRLIEFLWSGCFHVWEDVGEPRRIEFDHEVWKGIRHMQPMRCKKCGKRTRARC